MDGNGANTPLQVNLPVLPMGHRGRFYKRRQEMKYIDLHTHTNRSDGFYRPDVLVRLAKEAGLHALAITDHNEILPDLEVLSARHGIELIRGCEFSVAYRSRSGKKVELHIVGLDFDPEHPQIQAVLQQNHIDRKPYVDAILSRLRGCGIEIGTYETLLASYPETKHLGRKAIAYEMTKRGAVSSVDEAFDLYIGAFGERRAYVKNPGQYVDLKTCISAIRAAGGIPILAHLYYYQLSEEENRELLSEFRALTGAAGGMEVYYAQYNDAQRQALLELCREFGLYPSAGSDFHGQSKKETLRHQFPYTLYEAMKSELQAEKQQRV